MKPGLKFDRDLPVLGGNDRVVARMRARSTEGTGAADQQ